MVKNDDGPSGNMNDFELMVACLLPCDLVENRETSNGGSDAHATIAESTAEVLSTSTSGNHAIGKQECIFVGIRLRSFRS